MPPIKTTMPPGLRQQDLRREIAGPSLTSVRQVWNAATAATGLTPQRLAQILRGADGGDLHDYLTLAEEMEERDPHYAAVLGVRKRAVLGLEPVIEAASDAARDIEIADAVRELVAAPQFADLMADLLDALGKGFSVCEIVWDTGARWAPAEYLWRDPRWFQFDRDDGRTLRLIDASNIDGLPLPPYKFAVHVPRLKSGLPARGGLARLAAASWMCKSYTVADWMAFAEVFGMPLRLGRYGPGASEADIQTLIAAVANLGHDAAAVLPDSMRIEFQEAGAGAGGHELYLRLAEWLDRQISKAVLGQTMTADAGSSYAQAQVHNDVRADILEADARQLAATVQRDVIVPFVTLNFGPQTAWPRFTLPVREPEDITALADALAKLVPLGNLGIQASVVRDRLGFPDPEQGAELLGQPPQPPALQRAQNRRAHPPPHPAQIMTDTLTGQADDDIARMLGQIRAMLDQADSLEQFREMLLAAYGDLDSAGLAEALGQALAAARLAGRYDIAAGRGQD